MSLTFNDKLDFVNSLIPEDMLPERWEKMKASRTPEKTLICAKLILMFWEFYKAIEKAMILPTKLQQYAILSPICYKLRTSPDESYRLLNRMLNNFVGLPDLEFQGLTGINLYFLSTITRMNWEDYCQFPF